MRRKSITLPFLSAVLDETDFKAGRIHTGYIEEHFPEGFSGTAPTEFQPRIAA